MYGPHVRGNKYIILTIYVLNFGPDLSDSQKTRFMVDFMLFIEFLALEDMSKTVKRASNTELLKSNYLKPLSLVIRHIIIIAY